MRKREKGFTLVEAIVSLVMLAIVVLGAALYRYSCALDGRKAAIDMLANRIGLLLLESWHGKYETVGAFDPTKLSTAGSITVASGSGPGVPDGTFASFGNYTVTGNVAGTSINNINFYVTLSSKDGGGGLKIINMNMRFSQRGIASATLANSEKSLSLTTYKYQ